MAVRRASAEWRGDLPGGSGSLKTDSGTVEGAYSFASRFQEGTGTNPEELIAAAHAGCFSMAFANGLAGAGFTATSVRTRAAVHLEKGETGFSITRIELHTEAEVPGIDEETFQAQARAAKAGCPISRLLTGAEIVLQATLVA
jgi:lipoyl-dependent peroxiredoxin